MKHYGKIETLYDRFDKTAGYKVNPAQVRREEFDFVSQWHVTEKIDGTSTVFRYAKGDFDIGGRTANTQWSPEVFRQLERYAIRGLPAATRIIQERGLDSLAFYGETYGPKIQKGGGRYRDDVGFAVFDATVNDSIWLNWNAVNESARACGLDVVPFLGFMSTDEIVELVRQGFVSTIAKDDTYIAEGVIARSPFYDNVHRRVMFKLKHSDF